MDRLGPPSGIRTHDLKCWNQIPFQRRNCFGGGTRQSDNEGDHLRKQAERNHLSLGRMGGRLACVVSADVVERTKHAVFAAHHQVPCAEQAAPGPRTKTPQLRSIRQDQSQQNYHSAKVSQRRFCKSFAQNMGVLQSRLAAFCAAESSGVIFPQAGGGGPTWLTVKDCEINKTFDTEGLIRS